MLIKGIRSFRPCETVIRTENSLLACYVFDGDASPVFPYLHARAAKVRWRLNPPYARFAWGGKECVVRSIGALAGHFADREEAEAFGRNLLAFLNALYEERAAIPPDEPDRAPPTVLEVLRILPRDNCGVCGKPTCTAFAAAVCLGEMPPWECPRFPRPRRGRFRFPGGGKKGGSWFELELDLPPAAGEPEPPSPAGTGQGGVRSDLGDLTAREAQVLELLALGFTNAEIAAKLAISPHTVKTHVVHIFEKLDVTDRTQAGVWASRCGLV